MVKKVAADGHEYDVSKNANAKEAPTNSFSVENVIPKSLSPEQLDFVTIIDYHYHLEGAIPDVTFLKKTYGFTSDEVEGLFSSCRAAIEERGINLNKFAPAKLDTPVQKSKLTPIQLIAANSLLDLTDTRSDKKKLQDLGVNSRSYQAWLKNPDFQDYLQRRAEDLIGSDIQHEAMLALADRVKGGDLKAIQYYHELTGRYVQASARQQASGGDIQQVIVRVVEILVEEIEDPLLAQRIADRLRGLVAGQQVAGLIPAPVEKPEVAHPREQTEGVKELMSKGLGYDQ